MVDARLNPQQARVLAALRIRGAHGICGPDFLLPNVIDGHEPITRVPARILELKEYGYDIRDAGRRSKCKVFRLFEREQEPRPAPAREPEAPGLFTPPPRLAVFDEDIEAA